jgi:hypothetical protein
VSEHNWGEGGNRLPPFFPGDIVGFVTTHVSSSNFILICHSWQFTAKTGGSFNPLFSYFQVLFTSVTNGVTRLIVSLQQRCSARRRKQEKFRNLMTKEGTLFLFVYVIFNNVVSRRASCAHVTLLKWTEDCDVARPNSSQCSPRTRHRTIAQPNSVVQRLLLISFRHLVIQQSVFWSVLLLVNQSRCGNSHQIQA